MTNEQEQKLHEQLCAYVLGEATSEERAEIERELLRSPELRAQRDTIERTIGLVKTAMGSGETLSPEAAETLYSAASSSSRPSAWKSSGLLRLAAGLGAVALGYAIVRESTQKSEMSEVARYEDRSDKRAHPMAVRPMESSRAGDDTSAIQPSAGRDQNVDVLTLGVEPAHTPKLESSKKLAGPAGDSKAANGPGALPTDGYTQPFTAASNASGKRSDEQSLKLREAEKSARADELVQRQRDLDAAYLKNSGYLEEGKKDQATIDTGDSVARGHREEVLRKLSANYEGMSPARPEAAGTVAGSTIAPVSPGQSAPKMGDPAPPPASKPADLAGAVRTGGLASTGYGGPAASSPTSGPAVESKSKGRASYRGAGDTVAPGGGGQPLGGIDPVELKKDELKEVDAYRMRRAAAQTFTGSEFLGFSEETKSVQYYQLSPADQQIYLERQCRLILEDCARRPNEKPRDMFFRFWGDNPFEVTALDPQSTFAADVDTASYALARRYLNEGNVPEKAQIRTEEFVNYFKSDVAAPTAGVFAIHTDLAPSRFSTDTTRQMLRVVVRGKDLSKIERPRMNLTFVVDVSGSMREQMRLEMVKTSIRLLVSQLDPYDKIGIVKFSTDASVVLPLTYVSEREKIALAIAPLTPDGSTNSNAGLELGYGMAVGGLDKEATNRVVFLSDGVANVGETDPAKIAERVKPMREMGIYLNTIGVGMNNHNDVLLEQLADKADGMCTYIDNADEAKKQLVDNFSGAFQPIARDVKIQVEFDSTQVLRYRLLGYENRTIADADFRNDKVDAGELGAGHQVTALYEIERQGTANAERPLATVRLRWKEPRNFGLNAESDAATEMSQVVAAGPVATFEGAGQSYRKAVIAAQFAEILRRSVHARGDSLDALLTDALKLQGEIPNDKDFTEFVTLVSKSKDLIVRTMPACDELCLAIDEVRESRYRRAQIETLQRELDQKTLDELRRQNDVLEAKLRELVRRRLENQPR